MVVPSGRALAAPFAACFLPGLRPRRLCIPGLSRRQRGRLLGVASKSIARAFPAIAGSPWGQGASGRPYWGIKPPAESRGIRRGASEGAPVLRLQSVSPPCASPSACTPLAIRPWPSARRRPRSAWRGRACCRTSQARCQPRACDWLHVEGQLQASRSALCSSGGRAHGLPASGHTFRNLID